MNPLYSQLQAALKLAGQNPGPIDGIWGPKTAGALKAWQKKNELPVTGQPDALTLSKLLGKGADARPILWLDEATRLMGLKEGAGKADNRIILDWADDLDLHYPHDSVPWCGLLVAHCSRVALPDEPLPANPLGARQYERFGVACLPQLGAIATFWRTSKASGLGHVGFLVGRDR